MRSLKISSVHQLAMWGPISVTNISMSHPPTRQSHWSTAPDIFSHCANRMSYSRLISTIIPFSETWSDDRNTDFCPEPRSRKSHLSQMARDVSEEKRRLMKINDWDIVVRKASKKYESENIVGKRPKWRIQYKVGRCVISWVKIFSFWTKLSNFFLVAAISDRNSSSFVSGSASSFCMKYVCAEVGWLICYKESIDEIESRILERE